MSETTKYKASSYYEFLRIEEDDECRLLINKNKIVSISTSRTSINISCEKNNVILEEVDKETAHILFENINYHVFGHCNTNTICKPSGNFSVQHVNFTGLDGGRLSNSFIKIVENDSDDTCIIRKNKIEMIKIMDDTQVIIDVGQEVPFEFAESKVNAKKMFNALMQNL